MATLRADAGHRERQRRLRAVARALDPYVNDRAPVSYVVLVLIGLPLLVLALADLVLVVGVLV